MNNDLEQFSEERLKDMQKHVTAGMTLGHADALLIRQAIDIALAAKQAKPVRFMAEWSSQHGGMECDYSDARSEMEEVAAEHDGSVIDFYTTPQPAHTEQVNSPCEKCKDSGFMDSGGTQPWGEPISVECDCTTTQSVHTEQVITDNVRDALEKALNAMQFMGDTLNNLDAVCAEDVEHVTPAFEAIRKLLAAAPKTESE